MKEKWCRQYAERTAQNGSPIQTMKSEKDMIEKLFLNFKQISKNCTKLMKECQKKDPDCPMPKMARESEEGEVWHGFTVIRQNGAFWLELPFGEGEESKRWFIQKIALHKKTTN